MAFLPLLLGASAAPAETPILKTGSELALPGGVRPDPALTRIILQSLDGNDRAMLDDCIAEHKMQRHDYAALLRTVRIGTAPGRALRFVRPALKPYCTALYGAHLFRYFLVEERPAPVKPRYRLVLANGGDFLDVYPRRSHGLNDIEAIGCTARECWGTRMAFDGGTYQAVRCSRMTWEDDRQVVRARRCE